MQVKRDLATKEYNQQYITASGTRNFKWNPTKWKYLQKPDIATELNEAQSYIFRLLVISSK